VDAASLLYTGFDFCLFDGADVQCGRIIDVDEVTKTISFQHPLPRQVLAGAKIRLSIHTVNNLILGNPGPVPFGEDTTTALGYIQPNTPVTIWYQNKHVRPTMFEVQLSLTYGAKKVT